MGEGASFAALAPLVSGAGDVSSGIMQSQALRAQGSYEKTASEINAQWQELQAKDAIKRGETEKQVQNVRTTRLIGAQRAAAAAGGVDPNAGSAAAIQGDTAAMGALDALTIENNAFKEALGYRASASATRSRGRFAQTAGNSAARQTLISSGLAFSGDLAKSGAYAERDGLFAPKPKNNPDSYWTD